MILKRVITSVRYVSTALRAAFASQPPKHPQSHDPDHVQVTKFNPYGEKDLRGYEHFEKLNENEKSYSPIHSQQYNPLAAYGLFSLLSNSVARFLGGWVPHPKSVIASDSLHLPRIHPNSVPIYDSIAKASPYLIINKIISKITPFSIAYFLPEPTLALLTYGLAFYVYYGTNWKTVQSLVIKLEYLPHTEEFAYQKISIWGELTTSRIRKNDLELVRFQDIFGENNYSEKSARGLYNRDVAFRVKGTKELLLFDKHGIWNEEGVNHSELV